MKRITTKPWFGPKRFGWGWTPITWEGWLSVLVWIGLFYLAIQYYGANWLLMITLIAVLIIFSYMTGGNPGSQIFNRSKEKK
jgi:hypothetical protein